MRRTRDPGGIRRSTAEVHDYHDPAVPIVDVSLQLRMADIGHLASTELW
jgi:hypothetical protein